MIPVPCELESENEMIDETCVKLYLIVPYLVDNPPPTGYDIGGSAIVNGCAYLDEIATAVPVISDISFQVSGSTDSQSIFCEDFDRVTKTGLSGSMSVTTLSPANCASEQFNTVDALIHASLKTGKQAKVLYAAKHPDGSWMYGEAVVTGQSWVLAARGANGRQFDLTTSGDIHYARCNANPVAATSQIEASAATVAALEPVTITVTAYDAPNNLVASGGASVGITHNGAGIASPIKAESLDNGLYTVTYTPVAADSGNTITFGFILNNVAGTNTVDVAVA